MAIFGIIKTETTVQVGDKTRLDGSKSFISKDEAAVTLVEIEPSAGAGFVSVIGSSNDDWFLDWVFATDGVTVVSLRITTDGAPITVTQNVTVVTAVDDKLFTNDGGITRYESEVLDLLPNGYSSFNFMHRKVRDLILDWFNEMGYRTSDNSKITVDEIIDSNEVERWSETWVLSMIYQDNSNSIDDKYSEKSKFYMGKATDSRNRSVFELDLNKDGQIDNNEQINVDSVRLVRR